MSERFESNPDVMLGKLAIRGTRIPVELLRRKMDEGATDADLLDSYPRLTAEGLREVRCEPRDVKELSD